VILIGGIHGNEIVGTNAIIYLTRYFLENVNTNETLSYYMRNRMMIFYPISNPYGFYNNVRVRNKKNNRNFIQLKRRNINMEIIYMTQIVISLII